MPPYVTKKVSYLFTATLLLTTPIPKASAQATQHLTLPQALTLATEHNRTLQMAHLGIEDAEQKRRLARSSYYPHIKNESTALHVTEVEGIVIPAGAFAHGTAAGPVPTDTVRIGQGAQNAYTSGTGLTQPITQLLRVHAGVRAATADLNLATLEATDAENATALLVHRLYFDILIAQDKHTAAEESVKAGAVTAEETKQAVTEGRSLDLATLEAHAALLEQRQASLTAELAIDDLMNRFDDVLGLPLRTKLDLDPAMLGEPANLPSEAEAITQIRAHNVKVRAATQTVQKAQAGLSAAKTAYIPDVTGLARWSYQSGVPLLVHNFGTFGGLVSYELFDGGAREARLQQARIELHIAQLKLAQTEADASVQLSATYDEIRKVQHLIDVARDTLTLRTEAARISRQRMAQNAALASDVAKAAAGQAAAQASVLQATLELLLLQNQVKDLLGQRPD